MGGLYLAECLAQDDAHQMPVIDRFPLSLSSPRLPGQPSAWDPHRGLPGTNQGTSAGGGRAAWRPGEVQKRRAAPGRSALLLPTCLPSQLSWEVFCYIAQRVKVKKGWGGVVLLRLIFGVQSLCLLLLLLSPSPLSCHILQ